MSDINGAIDDHATGTYTVLRRPAGKYVKGKLVRSDDVESFPIVASVQPLSGELQDLPEGKSATDVKLVLTATEIRTETKESSPGAGDATEADMVVIDGEKWRVHAVDDYTHWGDKHYEATVVRVSTP